MMEKRWSDSLAVPGEGLIVLMGKWPFFKASRQNPKCRGSALWVWTQASPNISPLLRGFNSCLETSSSGLLGSRLRYWQESLNRAIVHDREIMKPACEWVGVIQRPENMGKESSKCRPDPTPLSSPTFIIDFIIFLTFCWGGLVFKSMGSGSRRSSYQSCGLEHVI